MMYHPVGFDNYGGTISQQIPPIVSLVPLTGIKRTGKRTRRGGRGRNRRRGRKQQQQQQHMGGPIQMIQTPYGQMPLPLWGGYMMPATQPGMPPCHIIPPPLPQHMNPCIPPSRHVQFVAPKEDHPPTEEKKILKSAHGTDIYLLPGAKNTFPPKTPPTEEKETLKKNSSLHKQDFCLYDDDAYNYSAHSAIRVTLDDLDDDDCSFSYDGDEYEDHSDFESDHHSVSSASSSPWKNDFTSDQSTAWRTAFDQTRTCVSINTLCDLITAH
eukprot:CAMPEP_0197290682 /NCGR_PEP_ID=MMETSP0890-20130614/8873_1 /TAXON_ID=44058 ORGANISM="Aureoumbra lagunensis, Strain CCMP1510" /NCGR_SAMPLE_ID=MMETSP0890 /ASSEMBLY_ACC=CAM_ASM_000533 /LENGTH=268 /DNA_ID=CAMNT_0042762849 /DNA_START=86 /DNA_END=892 /DNA_ORIENTATION=+